MNGLEDIRKLPLITAFELEFLKKFSRERFGLVRVDFEDGNRTRTKKKSAEYYAQVIKTHCILESAQCVE